MPRTTRAALRSKELAEEEAIALSIPLPTTPQKERLPLGEIVGNKGAESIMVDSAEAKPVKHAGKKGRKIKGARKGNSKEKLNNPEQPEAEVLEDDNRSSTSSAVDEAREMLMNTTHGTINTNNALPLANSSLRSGPQTLTDDGQSAPSYAIDEASESKTPLGTSHCDLEVRQDSVIEGAEMDMSAVPTSHFESEVPPSRVTQGAETVKTAAPPSQNNVSIPEQPTKQSVTGDGAKEDSFVEQIKSRSPAKRISRIEDSVEALDKLEDEIEKAGQAITPPPADGSRAPPMADTAAKATQPKKDLAKANEKAGVGANSSKNGVLSRASGVNKVGRKSSAQHSIKPKENRASLLRQGIKPAPPPRVTRAPSNPPKQVIPATISPADRARPAVSVTKTASPPKRISSVTKAPFQPAKSSKALTQSSFELPGEAFSRKLKAQREERSRREEEAKSKKQTFKARPVRLSQAPEVRMTAATKARLSMSKQSSRETPQYMTKRPSLLTSSISSLNTNKRTSSLSLTKRSSPPTDSDAKRGSSRTSVSGEPRTAPTAGDLANQKFKGKELFARPRNAIAAREKERREKEEAAKRARIEAAERGRVASREWAEKQRAKKIAETATKQATTV